MSLNSMHTAPFFRKFIGLPCLLLVALVSSAGAAEPFQFQKGDVVAIFGNGLADRMQHDPWVETALQSNL